MALTTRLRFDSRIVQFKNCISFSFVLKIRYPRKWPVGHLLRCGIEYFRLIVGVLIVPPSIVSDMSVKILTDPLSIAWDSNKYSIQESIFYSLFPVDNTALQVSAATSVSIAIMLPVWRVRLSNLCVGHFNYTTHIARHN